MDVNRRVYLRTTTLRITFEAAYWCRWDKLLRAEDQHTLKVVFYSVVHHHTRTVCSGPGFIHRELFWSTQHLRAFMSGLWLLLLRLAKCGVAINQSTTVNFYIRLAA